MLGIECSLALLLEEGICRLLLLHAFIYLTIVPHVSAPAAAAQRSKAFHSQTKYVSKTTAITSQKRSQAAFCMPPCRYSNAGSGAYVSGFPNTRLHHAALADNLRSGARVLPVSHSKITSAVALSDVLFVGQSTAAAAGPGLNGHSVKHDAPEAEGHVGWWVLCLRNACDLKPG